MNAPNPAKENFQQEISVSDEVFLDVRKIFFKYLSHWIWFIVSIVVFSTLGYIYITSLSPLYKVTASILIKDHNKSDGFTTLEELDLFFKAKVVENEIEILRSYILLEEVVDELNLQVRYSVENGWKTQEVYGNLPVKIEIIAPAPVLFSRPFSLRFEGEYIVFDEKKYPPNALITDSFGSILISTTAKDSLPIVWKNEKSLIVNFLPKSSVVESLHSSLQVSLIKNTSVIKLTTLTPVPQRGKDFLNQLIITYNKAAVADKNNMAGITLNFIEERLALVEKNLQHAEQSVEQYKVEKKITDITTESSLFLQNIQINVSELSKVKTQLDVLQQIQQYVLSSTSNVAPATWGLSDPTLVSLIASLTEAEAERIRVLSATGPANARVKTIEEQIIKLKAKLIDNIYVLRRSLETTQRNLLTENRRMESIINSIPQKERELVDITRQKEVINQLYILLLSKREETAISYAATVADSRVVDEAHSTPFPVKPNKRMILMVFGFIGLLTPVVLIWLIDSFKTTITSKEILDNRLKAPVIGEVMLVEQANKIVFINKNKSRQAEQIRSLRTNIEFMQAGGGVKVILITSGISSEGKSFLTANIGTAFAMTGKKTIMLGFDLRKPGIDKIFGIDNNEGLSNYLAGQTTLEQIIRPTELSNNLDVITCGKIAPNPQELLLGTTLSQLFDELKAAYDCIVIDTSPVGIMSDALILGRFADVTIYVIRQNYTPIDRIRQINDLFHSKRLNNLGVVVNGIKEEKWRGYGYGYGYGSYKYYDKYYSNE